MELHSAVEISKNLDREMVSSGAIARKAHKFESSNFVVHSCEELVSKFF